MKHDKLLNIIGVFYIICGFIAGVASTIIYGSFGFIYALVIWFVTFSNGYLFIAIADIISNQHFTQNWLSKIKSIN